MAASNQQQHQFEIALFLKEDSRGDSFLVGDYEGLDVLIPLSEITFFVFDPEFDDKDNIVAPGKLIITKKKERKKYGP